MRVGILNAGGWGTAVSKVLAEQGNTVRLWDPVPETVEEINRIHVNSRYLFGVRLPSAVVATTIFEEAATSDILLIATPSQYLLDVVRSLVRSPAILDGEVPIGVLTKGFLPTDKGPRLILDVMEDHLPGFYKGNLVYIAGPSQAEEVGRGKITGLIAASRNGRNAIRFRELLSGKTLIVFSSFDTIGVQTSAAYKNVMAIAFGILNALSEFTDSIGDNTESLLLAAGLAEIQTLGMALGSTYPETFTSIAGVGDLDVTCRSRYGRNQKFGREIVTDRILSRFKDIDDLMANSQSIGYLAEGVFAAKRAHEFAERLRIKLPIGESVYRILNREIEPLSAVEAILELIHRLPGGDARAEGK